MGFFGKSAGIVKKRNVEMLRKIQEAGASPEANARRRGMKPKKAKGDKEDKPNGLREEF